MSTATELLRRIQRYIGNQYLTAETLELSNDIDDFLAAEPEAKNEEFCDSHCTWLDHHHACKQSGIEPEAEYDFYGVIPLTHRKAKGIIKDKSYHVTGFVLSRPDGDKCIVDMSAVRWLSGKEFFEMMHPVVTSPTAEPEADEPVAWRCCVPGQDPVLLFDEPSDERYPKGYKEPLYTRPEPARKPMTEEEIDVGFNPYRMRWLADDQYFVAGIRFAEKHHGIVINQSDPDSIDLQSRCRGDKL